eukprot:tig00001497_g9209.t1
MEAPNAAAGGSSAVGKSRDSGGLSVGGSEGAAAVGRKRKGGRIARPDRTPESTGGGSSSNESGSGHSALEADAVSPAACRPVLFEDNLMTRSARTARQAAVEHAAAPVPYPPREAKGWDRKVRIGGPGPIPSSLPSGVATALRRAEMALEAAGAVLLSSESEADGMWTQRTGREGSPAGQLPPLRPVDASSPSASASASAPTDSLASQSPNRPSSIPRLGLPASPSRPSPAHPPAARAPSRTSAAAAPATPPTSSTDDEDPLPAPAAAGGAPATPESARQLKGSPLLETPDLPKRKFNTVASRPSREIPRIPLSFNSTPAAAAPAPGAAGTVAAPPQPPRDKAGRSNSKKLPEDEPGTLAAIADKEAEIVTMRGRLGRFQTELAHREQSMYEQRAMERELGIEDDDEDEASTRSLPAEAAAAAAGGGSTASPAPVGPVPRRGAARREFWRRSEEELRRFRRVISEEQTQIEQREKDLLLLRAHLRRLQSGGQPRSRRRAPPELVARAGDTAAGGGGGASSSALSPEERERAALEEDVVRRAKAAMQPGRTADAAGGGPGFPGGGGIDPAAFLPTMRNIAESEERVGTLAWLARQAREQQGRRPSDDWRGGGPGGARRPGGLLAWFFGCFRCFNAAPSYASGSPEGMGLPPPASPTRLALAGSGASSPEPQPQPQPQPQP